MSDPSFVPDEPNDLSIHLLIRNLRSDCQNKSVSPKNHAHRSRVIRQQIEMFARVERSGTVQSFDDASGYGSIRPDDGGSHVGFETTDPSLVGVGRPKVGTRLTYRLLWNRAGASVVDVRRVLTSPSRKRRETFTIFRSAAEEADASAAQDSMDNEGGFQRQADD
jgi:cold shock CspA family protein